MTLNLPYRLLAFRMNMQPTPAPVSKKFIQVLKYLYTKEEAWLVSRMPLMPSTAEEIAAKLSKKTKLVEKILSDLTARGLLLGMTVNNERKYQIPAFVPGISEFQFLDGKDTPLRRKFAADANDIINNNHESYYGKFDKMKSSFARVIPINERLSSEQKMLHYEDVRYIIKSSKRFAIGHCYCRQKKKLIDEEPCAAPIEICMQLGFAADYVIENNLGREITMKEMMNKLDLAEEHNLVHLSDNYQNGGFTFVCNCCGCCCNVLGAITRHNRNAPLVLSSKVIEMNKEKCTGCGKCSRVCQVQALSVINKRTVINKNRCLGCGYCIDACRFEALSLVKRPDWSIPPEDYGDMAADLVARRLHPGLRIPFQMLNGRKILAKKMNTMIAELT